MNAFVTPLAKRKAIAERRRRRYWSDEAYRLKCINDARARRDLRPIVNLDERGDPKRGRVGAKRGPDGRFVPALEHRVR